MHLKFIVVLIMFTGWHSFMLINLQAVFWHELSRASLGPIVEKCSLKGVGNLFKVIDRYDKYFHILYYLIVLTTRHAVVNSFPSPLRISFGFNETIMIIGCLCGFHFIIDSISELSVITSVLRILCFYCFPFSFPNCSVPSNTTIQVKRCFAPAPEIMIC